MEENQQLPPGFRFHPTDEELITCYLSRKMLDSGFVAKAITDVDLNKCEPWDLPAKASMGEKVWYFFSLRDRKYPTGLRTNRATDSGYWKTTGKDKELIFHCSGDDVIVGMKKTLVFYKGRAPKGEKTNWVMHEYRQQNKFPYKPAKEEWVVCRVFKKSSNAKKPQPNNSTTSTSESPCDTTSVTEVGELDARIIMNNNLAGVHAPGSYNSMPITNESSSSSTNNNTRMDHMSYLLYMDWMLAREASSTQPLLPWLGSTSPSVHRALPLNGHQAMEATNMSSLNSLLGQGGVGSLQQQQQQQQREHELLWRGY